MANTSGTPGPSKLHWPALRAYAVAQARKHDWVDDEEQQDLVQEAALALCVADPSRMTEDQRRAFLRGTVRRQALLRLRRRGTLSLTAATGVAAPEALADAHTIARVMRTLTRAERHRLSDLMHAEDSKSLATRLRVSRGTVDSWRSRLRRRIAELGP